MVPKDAQGCVRVSNGDKGFQIMPNGVNGCLGCQGGSRAPKGVQNILVNLLPDVSGGARHLDADSLNSFVLDQNLLDSAGGSRIKHNCL
jgi:hypothetical protein